MQYFIISVIDISRFDCICLLQDTNAFFLKTAFITVLSETNVQPSKEKTAPSSPVNDRHFQLHLGSM